MGGPQLQRLEERIAYELMLIVGMSILAFVQVTLLPTPFGFPPALVLIVVICRMMVETSRPQQRIASTLRSAFYGGIMLDLTSATPLGSHALALIIAVTLVFAIVRKMHTEGIIIPLIVVLFSSIVYEGILAIVYASTAAGMVWVPYVTTILLPSVLITLVPTLPIFYLLRWLASRRSYLPGIGDILP
jgi:rod shape-determining protein MreD